METQLVTYLFGSGVPAIALVAIFRATFFTVQQRTTAIADQRQAIVAGLCDSVDEFRKSVPGTTAKDVMNLVLMTQYFDRLATRVVTHVLRHGRKTVHSLSTRRPAHEGGISLREDDILGIIEK